MEKVLVYISGLMFGLGIVIGGMANPAKVQNFFDIAGAWDASLAFVMAGALAVTVPGYWLIFKRERPVFQPKFSVPTSRVIDTRLVLGSATFGAGWGIAGFCPGATIPVVSTLDGDVLTFLGAMLVGIFLARGAIKLSERNRGAAQPA